MGYCLRRSFRGLPSPIMGRPVVAVWLSRQVVLADYETALLDKGQQCIKKEVLLFLVSNPRRLRRGWPPRDVPRRYRRLRLGEYLNGQANTHTH